MTSKKTTRRALLSSAIALLLCVSMLVGSTFAWFTDEVTSTGNIIKSGTLDVEMLWADGTKAVPSTEDGWTDASTGAIFNYDKWEPGYTEVRHVKIANVGTLALKYALNIIPTGEVSDLADVIDVYYMDSASQIADRTALKDENKIGTLTEVLAGMATTAIGELEAGKSVTVTLALKMQETAGNDYQNKSIGSDFAVQLLATQLTYEKDSFGPDYDEDAVATSVVVTSEEELVEALANAKNGAVIGIKGNVTWTTGAGIGSTPFVTNAETITLVGVGEDSTFTAIGSGVGGVGKDEGTVIFKNLKIVDKSVSYAENSWEYGYLEFRGNTVFENCDVVNAIMMEGVSAKFVNCTFNSHDDNQYAVWVSDGSASFTGCTFTGARGLKTHEAYGSEVKEIVVDDCVFGPLTKKPGIALGTLNAETTVIIKNSFFAGTQAGDQGNFKYETDTDVTTFNFTDENNMVAGYADDNQDLKDQLQNNATVVLVSGEYSLPTLSGKEGITIIGAADGSTVVGGESASTGFGGNFGKNTTIKNVTFNGSTNGVRYSYAQGGTSTFENCTFAGDSTYGFHIDQSNGATFIFNNCTFSGFNAFAGDLEKVIFNNCTFLNNGNYGHTNIWSVAELNNCTFGDNTSISTKNKLIIDGVEENYHHEYIGSAESLFAFAESVNEGGDSWTNQAVILVADIDLENKTWTPIGQTGATQFKGIFDGQDHTIKNLNVDSSAQTGAHYSSGLFGWLNKATVKNLTIDTATVTGNHNVGVIAGYMETAGCTISNCHVINATVVAKHANDDACGDKVGVIVGHAGNAGVKVENCSAKDSTVTAGRDAGQIVGAAKSDNVIGCTAENVTVTAGGDCTGANVNNDIIGRKL